MSEIAVHLLKSGAPINALVGVPTITIYRLDTGAAVITAAVLTDRTASGLYTYDFTIAIDGINYSFLIDADPTAINQVDTRPKQISSLTSQQGSCTSIARVRRRI